MVDQLVPKIKLSPRKSKVAKKKDGPSEYIETLKDSLDIIYISVPE